MSTSKNMEERLWDYIDGLASAEERTMIDDLLRQNAEWQQAYQELREVQLLLREVDLEKPSLRFSKNVMEEISLQQIAPATRNYINKKVVGGIGLFLVLIILGFLVYGFFSQVNWSDKSGVFDLPKISPGQFFNNTLLNAFMLVNGILGLFLLDRFLASQRQKYRKEA